MAGRTTVGVLATALVAPMHALSNICQPATNYPDPVGRDIELSPLTVTLDKWDESSKLYIPQGLLSAQALHAEEFAAMTHGPKIRKADVRTRQRTSSPEEFARSLPPVHFTGTDGDQVWMLDAINATAAPLGSARMGSAWRGQLKMMGWSVAPSTMYPIENGDSLQGFLIAGGNPFVMDPGNHSRQMSFGDVSFMDASGCVKLFPVLPDPTAATGRVMNTIDCHARTGVCFFSAWKFDGMSSGLDPWPDCLWYCKVDNMSNPSKCDAVGVMADENGQHICRDYRLGGGVHGLSVMHDDPDDPDSFDVLLVFTAGMGYVKGTSWMSMLRVSVSDTRRAVFTKSQRLWGASLWNDTVTKPNDVGCDHAELDEAGNVWVSTFRKRNAGLHMLDYAGNLQYSIHGFGDYVPAQYSYPAGVSGYGTLLQPNSMMALATSAERGGLPIWGKGTMFFIDISAVITGANATRAAGL